MAVVQVSEDSLRRQIAGPAFANGLSLADQGGVTSLSAAGASITALVDGQAVTARVTTTGIDGDCACPESAPCAHAVAAVLAWVRTGDEEPAPDLYELLRDRSADWLARELARAAEHDPALTSHLLELLDQNAAADDVAQLRDELTEAIADLNAEVADCDWDEEWYPDATELEEIFDDLDYLIDEAPDAVREVAEEAIRLIETVLDSERVYGSGLDDAFGRAHALHLAACQAGSPDPHELAHLLIMGALNSQWGAFERSLPGYADVLGPEGLAHCERLLEQSTAADYKLEALWESYARAVGGTDAVVEMLAVRDRGTSGIAKIARLLISDGRDDDALAWVEKGLAEQPADSHLLSLAVDLHRKAGRHQQVLDTLWRMFIANPAVHTFNDLVRDAGADRPAWNTRAIAHLRSHPPRDPGVLPAVLLATGDAAGAWEAIHQNGGLGITHDLRMRVVNARAATHPQDVVPIYQDLAATQVSRGSRPGYQEAITYLRTAHNLAARCDRRKEFATFMARLRAAHPGKKVFHEMLSQTDLP